MDLKGLLRLYTASMLALEDSEGLTGKSEDKIIKKNNILVKLRVIFSGKGERSIAFRP